MFLRFESQALAVDNETQGLRIDKKPGRLAGGTDVYSLIDVFMSLIVFHL